MKRSDDKSNEQQLLHIEQAEIYLRNKLYHHALSTFYHCAKNTNDESLFFRSLLGLSECFLQFRQFYPAMLVTSYCHRLSSSLPRISSEAKQKAANQLRYIREEYSSPLADCQHQLNQIVQSIFGVYNTPISADSFFYLSTTIQGNRPAFPLFHSFGTSVHLGREESGATFSADFKFVVNIFDFTASQDVEEYYEDLSRRFDENCNFSPDSFCFGRGRSNSIGVILYFEPDMKWLYGELLTGLLPPFEITQKKGGRLLGDMLPGAHLCLRLGLEAEYLGDIPNAHTWFAVGAGAASYSDDLETTLYALINFARLCRMTEDIETASKVIDDINHQQNIHKFSFIDSLINRGALTKTPAPTEKLDHNEPLFIQAPTSEEMPKGSSYGSTMREFYVLSDLYEAWRSEFPDLEPPLSKPVAFARTNHSDSGVPFVEYKDAAYAHRLSSFADINELLQNGLVSSMDFSRNMFRTLRAAHKILLGSFTNEAGSGLFLSNITLNGEIIDLETFHSPRYGDHPVEEHYYVEDVRLAIEALKDFCLKLSSDKSFIEREFEQSLVTGFEIYTESGCPDYFLAGLDINRMINDDGGIPSRIKPSGNVFLDIARKFRELRQW